jgi:ADP-ribosylglycohydrolase
MDVSDRIRGCLLGGAVGDALGAGVEFWSAERIARELGPGGVVDPLPAYGHACPITDDTQMTLFTAEGLLRARAAGETDPVPSIHRAYLRWLHTQGATSEHPQFQDALDGWLVREPALHSARAPGNTCIGGLTHDRAGTIEAPLNDSKGCGGVMRIAPVGLLLAQPGRVAARACALTHGHRAGWAAGAAFAEILADVLVGASLHDAATRVAADAALAPDEVGASLRRAIETATSGRPTVADIEALGGGWVAEEALAIAVACALAYESAEAAMRAAVSHSGDSDSTGSLAGQLCGAIGGEAVIPRRWSDVLELREVVLTIADDLAAVRGGAPVPVDRYPPG